MEIWSAILTSLIMIATLANAVLAENNRSTQSPEEVVRQLYKTDPAIVVSATNYSRVPTYFDKQLTDLILKDHYAKSNANVISFDPLFDTNGDTRVNKFQIASAKVNGNQAQVLTSFNLPDSNIKKSITFSLHQTPKGWRISNLTTPDWDLHKVLIQLHGQSK